jgi:hypothetical protein
METKSIDLTTEQVQVLNMFDRLAAIGRAMRKAKIAKRPKTNAQPSLTKGKERNNS